MAGYHQFHAVNVAVEETLRAAKAREGLVQQITDLAVIPVTGALA